MTDRGSNIFMVLLLTVFIACKTDKEEITKVTEVSKLPQESGRNVEILYSDSGMIQMKLTSSRIDRHAGETPYLEFPEGLVVDFYDENLNIKSKLSANYAIRYEKEKKMEAKKNVVVVNVKGEKLNTEHLIWDEAREKIYTNEFVKITMKDEVLYGEGLESNQDFTRYRILKIKGTLSIEDEGKTNN